ncbi:MAG TPA: hypothetical protein P5186_28865 [Candidatus Paceibacterota bacterium]|nr:hypothetical protein [Candidatus Paceibacterota bacterium]
MTQATCPRLALGVAADREVLDDMLAGKNSRLVKLGLTILILVLLGWILSGIVHELGHAIVGKMAGLNVLYIQLFPPRVRLSGEAADSWNAAISISGILFAVLVGLAGGLAVVLLGRKWPGIRYAIWLFVPMMAQALGWLCASLALVFGMRLPGSDVQTFTQQAGWPPLIAALIGIVMVMSCVAILKWLWS